MCAWVRTVSALCLIQDPNQDLFPLWNRSCLCGTSSQNSADRNTYGSSERHVNEPHPLNRRKWFLLTFLLWSRWGCLSLRAPASMLSSCLWLELGEQRLAKLITGSKPPGKKTSLALFVFNSPSRILHRSSLARPDPTETDNHFR